MNQRCFIWVSVGSHLLIHEGGVLLLWNSHRKCMFPVIMSVVIHKRSFIFSSVSRFWGRGQTLTMKRAESSVWVERLEGYTFWTHTHTHTRQRHVHKQRHTQTWGEGEHVAEGCGLHYERGGAIYKKHTLNIQNPDKKQTESDVLF